MRSPAHFPGFLTYHPLSHSNVIGHLGEVVSQEVRERQVALFNHVNTTLAQAIAAGVGVENIQPMSFYYGATWLNHTVYSTESTLNFV